MPTASYRMGVPSMGLGLVTISSQGHVFYTNLWLPSRSVLVRVSSYPPSSDCIAGSHCSTHTLPVCLWSLSYLSLES